MDLTNHSFNSFLMKSIDINSVDIVFLIIQSYKDPYTLSLDGRGVG